MIRLLVITLALILLIILSFPVLAGEQMIGIGFFSGEQVSDDPIWHTSDKYDWDYTIIHPIYGWHMPDRWDVFFEGNLGLYNFESSKDVYSFGISLMTDYDFIKVDPIALYGEAGVGFGYWSDTPNEKFVATKTFEGFFQYGVGLKATVGKSSFVKIGYRLHHVSDPFASDARANSNGVMISFIKTF